MQTEQYVAHTYAWLCKSLQGVKLARFCTCLDYTALTMIVTLPPIVVYLGLYSLRNFLICDACVVCERQPRLRGSEPQAHYTPNALVAIVYL